jgi:hypothetical protein
MTEGKVDKIYRNFMLAMGVLTALLFILSLIALIEFPKAFKGLAFSMIGTAVLFLLLRSIFIFRNTFKVRAKNKTTQK